MNTDAEEHFNVSVPSLSDNKTKRNIFRDFYITTENGRPDSSPEP